MPEPIIIALVFFAINTALLGVAVVLQFETRNLLERLVEIHKRVGGIK